MRILRLPGNRPQSVLLGFFCWSDASSVRLSGACETATGEPLLQVRLAVLDGVANFQKWQPVPARTTPDGKRLRPDAQQFSGLGRR